MAPPPARILEGVFGMLDHRVLVAICQAGVPEALTGPRRILDLAAELDADPAMLERLLRFAATRGWVGMDRRGRVRPNAVTAFLRHDHPGGWRAWVDFSGGEEVVTAVAGLTADSSRADGFAQANGAPFFEWMADHPDRWATFDRAMAAGGRMHGLVLAAALDWDGTESICDVGGGTGALAATLLEMLPGRRATVLDLPGVVERAVDHPRLTAVGGDAFEQVPPGFDTYLLVNVVHDWDDRDASRILQRVAEAAEGRARVVVVDSERTIVPRPDMAVAADVLMAALTDGGKERTASELRTLGRSAGLELDHSTRLASGDVAHVFGVRVGRVER
ncbi:methyltransferase [Rhabdothermincola salaria]|uniref:methyltransferase n=1 Tax=Rhabdothermincola salaria TaxID=2903142 RepID=UPI001E30664A|nr:methyltransferase [Rhabdothermincola salaria]MCD9625426.1 hypothetical protein [Rhabdothermincola salaria]